MNMRTLQRRHLFCVQPFLFYLIIRIDGNHTLTLDIDIIMIQCYNKRLGFAGFIGPMLGLLVILLFDCFNYNY